LWNTEYDSLCESGSILTSIYPLDSERKKVLFSFQSNLAIKFKNIDLLNTALIHKSLSNEREIPVNNERLEFLGDAVLGMITATLLFKNFVDKNEGQMAKTKAAVVSEETLARKAREMQIGSVLLMSKGEEQTGGRKKNAILADALEALVAAFYLDSGYNPVFEFVSNFIEKEIIRMMQDDGDYKSKLQEISLHRFKTYPVYRLVKYSGPEHERSFFVEVTVNGESFGPTVGKNKKTAEQEVAKMALSVILEKESLDE
jgi:ribonuclease-3